jgi:AcrR family transcriptional regulator
MIPGGTIPQKARTPDERRAGIVAVAREAFFAEGYGATSMSAIASKVGGSKTTLWTYFPSKQELFAAVADDLVKRFGLALEVRLSVEADLATELRQFARALLGTLHTQAIVDMHRLVIGEAGRFPELGSMMYERGPARGKARLAQFFEQCMVFGMLRKGSGARAADQLAAMIQTGSSQRRLLGLIERPTDEELDREAEDAVHSFLHGWAA